jgi:twinkle protein
MNGKFGFRESELTIWAGFKGHGKSLVISQVFEQFLERGKKCFIISPEFPPHRVLYRMMCQSFGKENITPEIAFQWMEALEKNLWLYDQQSSLQPQDVVALCRYAVEVHGVDHILIDSLMKCGIPPDDYGKQKKLVDMIQQVAHRNKVHIHLVAHARKQQDDSKIGGLHDIKGASEIGDMAENVLFVWRNKQKELGAPNTLNMPDAILKVEAQRNGDGWIGTTNLQFQAGTFTFKEMPCVSQN